jgi:putative copper resistance protein D
LAATVSASHAAARMDNRWLLGIATAIHHLGTAAWIGAMPFLLISLPRAGSVEEAQALARRYSSMALLSVAALVLAGVYLAWSYIGTWNGLYGTSYGVLLLAKIYLLLLMLLMGAGNAASVGKAPSLCRGRGRVGIYDHSGGCIDVCAAPGG